MPTLVKPFFLNDPFFYPEKLAQIQRSLVFYILKPDVAYDDYTRARND